jgi:hypothetical protein
MKSESVRVADILLFCWTFACIDPLDPSLLIKPGSDIWQLWFRYICEWRQILFRRSWLTWASPKWINLLFPPPFSSIYLVIAALSINGIGIGGEQVAGIVDALHEAV